MKDEESESEVRFGVTPFFDVPKIELHRFSAFPCNKKMVLTGFKGQYIRTKWVRFSLTPFFEVLKIEHRRFFGIYM